MELSMAGAAFVRLHEGFVDHWYLDPVGIPTIGIGFTWRSAAFRKWWEKNRPGKTFGPGAKMTREEAQAVLIDLFREEYGAAVDKFLGKQVAHNVFDGMASVVFNCGAGALKWKWAQAIKSGDIKGGAKLLETTAVTAQGKRLAGLVRRRKEEAKLIRDGIYTGIGGGTSPVVLDAMSDGVLRKGERGPAVAKLIIDLAALGYYKGVKDDVFGFGTEAAVLAFQRDSGLKHDGIAGPRTLELLADEAAPVGSDPAPIPAPPKPVVKPPVPPPVVPRPASKPGWMEWLKGWF